MRAKGRSHFFRIRACGLEAHRAEIMGLSHRMDTPLFPLGKETA